jgi:hypothetical protein
VESESFVALHSRHDHHSDAGASRERDRLLHPAPRQGGGMKNADLTFAAGVPLIYIRVTGRLTGNGETEAYRRLR